VNEGGHVSISIRADEHDALVTVVDDGAGIPNELLQRALDLALARRFSERAYTARIPLHEPAARSDMPPPTYRGSSRRRILVVDDHVDAAESLALLLRQGGHDVQVVHDGHAALEAARIHRPHLVLLDLGMPGVDGFNVVGRLRKDGRFAGVRFVAVTGSGEPEARERSRQAGFDEHLVKPLDLETLRRLIERP
jgi:CheY-like chemotaxis protein